MKFRNTLISGIAVFAVLAPASNALASTDDAASSIQSTDTSTTVPVRRDAAKAAQFRADMKAWQEATRTWLNGRATALTNHREAIASASATFKTSLAAATTREARKAAMEAFKAAREASKSELDAALAALGERPVRPSR
ncbi:MAG: hypothetical protein ACKOXX_05815 [Actinomycetota bacterium]